MLNFVVGPMQALQMPTPQVPWPTWQVVDCWLGFLFFTCLEMSKKLQISIINMRCCIFCIWPMQTLKMPTHECPGQLHNPLVVGFAKNATFTYENKNVAFFAWAPWVPWLTSQSARYWLPFYCFITCIAMRKKMATLIYENGSDYSKEGALL